LASLYQRRSRRCKLASVPDR